MVNVDRHCMKRANENLFKVLNILFDEDNEIASETRKLIFYQNPSPDKLATPLECKDVDYSQLFLKSVFPYKHVPDIQGEVKTYVNFYYDAFYLESADLSRRNEKGYLVIDIMTHKEMEIVIIDGVFALRKYEIMSRLRKLFDNNREINFLGGLTLYHWGEFDSQSAKHTALRLMFDVANFT